MNETGMSKHDHVLAGLVFNLQAMAMQQLGKLQNPLTGELQRDLDGVRGTIDLLEMLKVKCRAETPEELLRMLDGAVMDLQLNYMEEMKKETAAAEAPAPAEDGDDPAGESEKASDENGADA